MQNRLGSFSLDCWTWSDLTVKCSGSCYMQKWKERRRGGRGRRHWKAALSVRDGTSDSVISGSASSVLEAWLVLSLRLALSISGQPKHRPTLAPHIHPSPPPLAITLPVLRVHGKHLFLHKILTPTALMRQLISELIRSFTWYDLYSFFSPMGSSKNVFWNNGWWDIISLKSMTHHLSTTVIMILYSLK